MHFLVKYLVGFSVYTYINSSSYGYDKSLEASSSVFLGAPYSSRSEKLLLKLNESPSFDCQTLVEASISLAISKTEKEYYENLVKIRYFSKVKSEANRKHFISSDWIPELLKNHILEDITTSIYPSAREIKIKIEKIKWFKKTKTSKEMKAFLKSSLPKSPIGKLKYIPIEQLSSEEIISLYIFGDKSTPFHKKTPQLGKIFDKIPSGSILLFLSKHPDKYSTNIGSPLLVTHMGIAIKRPGTVYLRHADLPRNAVMDIPLSIFLRSNRNKFLGISVMSLAR